MPERRATIQVEPGSELDRLLDAAADTEILLVKGGVHYRLDRVDAPVSAGALPPRPKRLDPARVLEIIGLGESAEGSNVARHKHRSRKRETDSRCSQDSSSSSISAR